MDSGRPVCVNCKYEDASKRINSLHPDYPGPRGEMGIAVWCKLKQRYIANAERQGVRKKPDNTYEDYFCSYFVHY